MIVAAWIVAVLTLMAGIAIVQMKAMPPLLRVIMASGFWVFTALYTAFQFVEFEELARANAVRTGLVLMSVGAIWMRMLDFRSYAPLLEQNRRFAEEIEQLKGEIAIYRAERESLLARLNQIEQSMAAIMRPGK